MIPVKGFWLAVCGLVIAVSLFLWGRSDARATAALNAKIASLEAQTKALSREADSLENAFRVDTVRLTTLAVRSETTLTRIIDTALVEHHDTVRVPVEVLVTADSTIRYCKAVLSECSTGWDTEKRLNADLRAELVTVKAQRPSWLSERLGVGIGYGCTLHSGAGYCGPSVGALIRLWP